MATTPEELLSEVEEANTVADGLIALTGNIKAMLDAAVASGANLPAKITAISALISAQKQEIVDAVTRNTVAAEPTP